MNKPTRATDDRADDNPPSVRIVQPSKGKIGERPLCPKQHRFRPISFDEKTGVAIYACKCGIEWTRKAMFVCREEISHEH